jgi:hypothetical protein
LRWRWWSSKCCGPSAVCCVAWLQPLRPIGLAAQPFSRVEAVGSQGEIYFAREHTHAPPPSATSHVLLCRPVAFAWRDFLQQPHNRSPLLRMSHSPSHSPRICVAHSGSSDDVVSLSQNQATADGGQSSLMLRTRSCPLLPSPWHRSCIPTRCCQLHRARILPCCGCARRVQVADTHTHTRTRTHIHIHTLPSSPTCASQRALRLLQPWLAITSTARARCSTTSPPWGGGT